jgi:hypothetical protein
VGHVQTSDLAGEREDGWGEKIARRRAIGMGGNEGYTGKGPGREKGIAKAQKLMYF